MSERITAAGCGETGGCGAGDVSARKVIFIMVDGFGMPEKGWPNSVYENFCDSRFMKLLTRHSVPISASLGIDGIPQSATCQTALFTGINADRVMGMHMQGFPGPQLRNVITAKNLFSSLMDHGRKVAFANAYVLHSVEELARMKMRSVTTVMVESSLGWVRSIEELSTGKAVYHDITRKTLEDLRSKIPLISPENAAEHLVGISRENDLTLFEYFLTDKAGHKLDVDEIRSSLSDLSRFVCRTTETMCDNTVLVLTGDHGNCEDLSTRKHTMNPVPLLVYGKDFQGNPDLRSIDEVYHYVLKVMHCRGSEKVAN